MLCTGAGLPAGGLGHTPCSGLGRTAWLPDYSHTAWWLVCSALPEPQGACWTHFEHDRKLSEDGTDEQRMGTFQTVVRQEACMEEASQRGLGGQEVSVLGKGRRS